LSLVLQGHKETRQVREDFTDMFASASRRRPLRAAEHELFSLNSLISL
jgi:hypothetical protein